MVASLLKIVSTGMQDERLQPPKGQPSLSAFLTVMVKTGRYATNWARIDFDTSPDFGKSSIIRLPTKGEMIGRIFLVANMPDISTIQRKAYYTRKPTYLANSNYVISNLFSGTSYTKTIDYKYPVSINPLGKAKFKGIQLEDLSVDGNYSLTAYLPSNTNTNTINSFSIILSDKPFSPFGIEILNTDTYYLIGNYDSLAYSYDGINWASIFLSTTFITAAIVCLQYNQREYLVTGDFASPNKYIVIDNNSSIITQPHIPPNDNTSPSANRIAYNGLIYVMVGSWPVINQDYTTLVTSTISYSTDGKNWAPSFNPINTKSTYIIQGYPDIIVNTGNSVAWIESTKQWIAVGRWESTDSSKSYVFATSPDGMIWTCKVSPVDDTAYLSIAKCVAVNGYNVVVGGSYYNTNGNITNTLLFSSMGAIGTSPFQVINNNLINATTTNDVVWTGNLWVAVGNYIYNSENKSITLSPDGINWLPPVNPAGVLTTMSTGNTIGLSPTEMIIGGQWNLETDNSIVSLSKASGTILGYKWGTLIRPTDLINNILNIYSVSFEEISKTYLLLGNWSDSGGIPFGTMSISTDGQTWSLPIVPYDPTYIYSTAYAAATNGNVWLVVGFWRNTNIGTNIQGYTMMLSENLTEEIYTSWSPIDVQPRTGEAINVIYDSDEQIFIVVGMWSTYGNIVVSGIDTLIFSEPIHIKDTSNNNLNVNKITSIVARSTPLTYTISGVFYLHNGTGPYTIATISIDPINKTVSLINVYNPTGIDTSKYSQANEVSYNGYIYVATGSWSLTGNTQIGTISYSTDGINWIKPFNPPNSPSAQSASYYGNSVKWSGTQFVATGSWSQGTIIVSADGINWTEAINPPEVLNSNGAGVGRNAIWNGAAWVVAGNWFNNLQTALGNVDTFTYGINFALPVNPNGATNGTTNSIAWDPSEKSWIAASIYTWFRFPPFQSGYLSTSLDGVNWSQPFHLDSANNGTQITQIAFINNNKYIIGSINSIRNMLFRSTDTFNWSAVPNRNTSGNIKGLSYNENIWVAVAYFQTVAWTPIIGCIITSLDGINWSQPFVPTVTITPSIQEIIDTSLGIDDIEYGYSMVDVAWNGAYFVAVGSITMNIKSTGINYSISQIITSSDGINWVSQSIAKSITEFDADSLGYSVKWNGTIWLVTGQFLHFNGTITTSTDGVNWSVPVCDIPIVTQTFAYNTAWNGRLWIINCGKYILRTTDAITFSEPIDPSNGLLISFSLNSVEWNGTQFLLIGTDFSDPLIRARPLTFTSLDGINWKYNILNLANADLKGILTRRTNPYTSPQAFDPSISTQYQLTPNGYILNWTSDPVYGTGTQYFTNMTGLTPLTFYFKASKRTLWLTFGTYYNAPSVIDISLNLDRLGSINFQSDLVGPHFGWTNSLGHSLIDTVTLSIGGNLIENIPGQLMEILDEFQTPLEKVPEKNIQLCRSDSGFTQKTYGYSNISQEVITHLPFWFSRGDPGCVLPIDALNVDEVRLTVNFKPLNSVYYTDSRTATPAPNVEGGALWPLLNSQFYYQDPSGLIIPTLEPSRTAPQANPLLAFPNLNMPNRLSLQDTYLLVEYIYLDKAEANRFRIADIQVPVVQHYTIDPVDTNSNTYARVKLDIPNPTRDLFFYCQRYEAPSVNAHFLATRDLTTVTDTNLYGLWWPDASGLDARYYDSLKPGFSTRRSEPIRWLALNYAETLNRYSTENVALFRSTLPALEQRKAPWINRYYYNIPFGCQNGLNPFSTPIGQANLDKVQRINLSLGFHGKTGDVSDTYAERFWIRTYAETYNIFRVYGGRGAMMFAY